jgi:CDP-6-deoxy-D-xylo-4-hexulose-3-dehydrase
MRLDEIETGTAMPRFSPLGNGRHDPDEIDWQDGDAIRQVILGLVSAYHDQAFPKRAFVPGQSPVPVSGRTFDADDIRTLVDSSLDFWLTTGRYAARFERELADFVGARYALLCNSGSSANLLAVSSLTSHLLGDSRLVPGDEVLTVAAGFPTTVNPIIQNELVPVFVDVELGTYAVDVDALEAAVGPRTRAIILAHTLGNPFDLDRVMQIARKHDLWLIEDNCDALGSTYRGRHTGSFGALATGSFYPAHHITTGEGGCVLVNHGRFKKVVESFRDWGRDCWCEPGKENTCGARFDCKNIGELPSGYDHKYVYSHIGYNLKVTDMQAAVGVSQIAKLPMFVERRKHNFDLLRKELARFEDVFVLPQATPNSEPSWFGFPLTVRDDAPFGRNELIAHLDAAKIATRLLFAGNLTKQPAYIGKPFRVEGSLENTEAAMNGAFWLGVYPAITDDMIEYVADTIASFVEGRRGRPAA